jgi:hypothetical protein
MKGEQGEKIKKKTGMGTGNRESLKRDVSTVYKGPLKWRRRRKRSKEGNMR